MVLWLHARQHVLLIAHQLESKDAGRSTCNAHANKQNYATVYCIYIYIYVDDTRSRKHSRYHYDKHDDDHNGATAKIAWV